MRLKPAFPRGGVAVRRRDEAQLDHESAGVTQQFGPERLTAEGRWKHVVHPSVTDG